MGKAGSGPISRPASAIMHSLGNETAAPMLSAICRICFLEWVRAF
jgi:hypothetical protein